MSWQPAATLPALQQRARDLAAIREFFARRGVLEVETPILGAAGSTDPQIESLRLATGSTPWLQTSPEFHMKRLLAAGSGPIYQIARVFRADEAGRWHNPEFSLLEWYRPDYDQSALMDEIGALLVALGAPLPGERLSYRQAFERTLGLNPHALGEAELRAALAGCDPPANLDRDGLLDLAMGLRVAPALGREAPVFVTDFPASQAALARIGEEGLARRFELFWQGLELANGFEELADPREQARRFAADRERRAARGLDDVPADERLIAALVAGLPDCAGVALGLDRLFALLHGESDIAAVMAFPGERA